MPELTEITNETPSKVEETDARIEDDDDDDSDTIPELEDTGKYLLKYSVCFFFFLLTAFIDSINFYECR